MLDSWVIFLAAVFFLAAPLGLILVSLGLFNQRQRICGKCGYDRAGLRPETLCPECGAPAAAATYKEVLRNSRQVRIGVALLLVAGVPLLFLVAMLVRAAI